METQQEIDPDEIIEKLQEINQILKENGWYELTDPSDNRYSYSQ
jgi:hypothetical protein